MKRGFLNNNTRRNECLQNSINKTIECFELSNLLGSGNFTKVFKAYDKENTMNVAIKIANKSRLKALRKDGEILNEKRICMLLSNYPNKNVIKLLETFANTENVYLVYELCIGELWEKIFPIGIKPLNQAIYYLAQLLIAIEHIHHLDIIHRDIKAENCLITRNGQLKLADFGSSITLKDIQCNSQKCGSSCPCRFVNNRGRREFKYYVGTPQFMPPESIRNKPPTKAVDLWSFGCTVFQVIAGYPPFNAPSEFLVFCRIFENKIEFPPDFPEDAESLVKSLLKPNPSDRPTIQDIKRHRMFREIDFEKLTNGSNYIRYPPSLKDLCLIKISKFYENKKEEISHSNLPNNIKKLFARFDYDIKRKIYEGPRDSWSEEFSNRTYYGEPVDTGENSS